MAQKKCTLNLFKEKAYKNYEVLSVPIDERGRIYVRGLLARYRLAELRVIENGRDKGTVLDHDEQGYSVIYRFEDGGTYKLRQFPDAGYDEEFTFSAVTLEDVLSDFQVHVESSPSWLDEPPHVDLPRDLFAALSTVVRWNTLRSENSRRSIISLYLAYALHIVQPMGRTTISEEMQVKTVRETGDGVRRCYSGPVDFAIGHSQAGDSIPKDCALLVAEAKTPGEFGGAFQQVLAQAASNYFVRYERLLKLPADRRRVYWLLTDGARWKAGYVEANFMSAGLISRERREFEARLHPEPDDTRCSDVFAMLVQVLRESFVTSATTTAAPTPISSVPPSPAHAQSSDDVLDKFVGKFASVTLADSVAHRATRN